MGVTGQYRKAIEAKASDRTNHQRRRVMKTLAAIVLATMIASPAFAQSYDPSVGSGNIAPQVATSVTGNNAFGQAYRGPLAARAQLHMSVGGGSAVHAVKPFTADEKALFDRIRKE